MIFVRPRYEYQSYWDYFELIRLSGLPLIYFDEIDWGSKETYIACPMNGEFPTQMPDHTCRVIWLNIERPCPTGDPWLFGRPDFDEVWVCDRYWSTIVGARHFIMGSHAGLGFTGTRKLYDWISCTYEVPRRTAIWHEIRDLSRAPNGWPCTPQERAADLAASHLYVVPQQDDPPHAVTPLRFAIAAAFKLPMVYEGEMDAFPFVPSKHFISSNYHRFADTVRKWLGTEKSVDIGLALHHKLCIETDFKRSIEAML